MKWIHVVLFVLVVSPLAVLADKPATQPARPFAGRGDGGGGGGANRLLKRDGLLPGLKPTTEELQDAMNFVKETAPNHYELFNRLPENGPRRVRAEQLMVMRYHNLMRMKEQNPDAYDAMLSQWKLEDDAIGDARAIKDHKPDADVRLREVCRQMVQKSLDERRARIDKLRKALDDQQKQLDLDDQNKDTLMAQLVTETQKRFERLFGTDRDRGSMDNSVPPPGANDVNALPAK